MSDMSKDFFYYTLYKSLKLIVNKDNKKYFDSNILPLFKNKFIKYNDNHAHAVEIDKENILYFINNVKKWSNISIMDKIWYENIVYNVTKFLEI